MSTHVPSIIGTDRPGLVEALAGVVAEHGGNWERSHVTELAGTFAGVVLVTVPDARSAAFVAAAQGLHAEGLEVTVRGDRGGGDDAGGDPSAGGGELAFELVGNDRPGIVRELGALLASLDVSIVDLRSWTSSAAMAGGTLFHAAAVVRLPVGLAAAGLVEELEGLANELMVDLTPIAPAPA